MVGIVEYPMKSFLRGDNYVSSNDRGILWQREMLIALHLKYSRWSSL